MLAVEESIRLRLKQSPQAENMTFPSRCDTMRVQTEASRGASGYPSSDNHTRQRMV